MLKRYIADLRIGIAFFKIAPDSLSTPRSPKLRGLPSRDVGKQVQAGG
jgi:hypothetical protein